jgi:hypothetical protein
MKMTHRHRVLRIARLLDDWAKMLRRYERSKRRKRRRAA